MLPALSHRNLILEATAATMYERSRANGGGTFRLSANGRLTELRPAEGYAVGLTGGWTGEADYDALLGALYDLERAGRLPGTFGTWMSEGRLYVDPVSIVDDLDSAIGVGMANGQEAIYSFGAERDIRLKCARCGSRMWTMVPAHGHTDDGKDVTGR
jgi:hypothetical protein